ncbi:MAG: hypothetical protein AB7F65_05575 [Dehalococcoidia bacterium]
MDLDTMRARVRTDLRDPSAERWDDAALDRHIERALAELSLAAPREATTTLLTVEGARDLDLSVLGGLIAVDAVEYPAGQYPPAFVPFSIWGDTLTLDVDSAPPAGQEVHVRYSAAHVLDGEGTTLPDPLHDLVATGAAAYAAIEWASYATNRINVGGDDVWRRYLAWGQDRLASFSRALAKHGRERRLKSRRLYVAAVAGVGRR